jgi:uncharacterized protein YfcZ (UPF0381/DUF406 family)
MIYIEKCLNDVQTIWDSGEYTEEVSRIYEHKKNENDEEF